MIGKVLAALGVGVCMALAAGVAFSPVSAAAAYPEYNAVRTHPVDIGPEAGRLIVGFRATANNVVVQSIHSQVRAKTIVTSQALTSASDVVGLAQRVHLNVAKSRQLTPSMHVMVLQKTLYGSDVDSALTALRADPAVKFAAVDQRRYPHTVPDDILFGPSTNSGGQWYMQTPSTLTATSDAAATDAVSAWTITTGSTGTVIADVDTGVRFDHPDLLRAGFGGRLLPGYDFVDQDYSPTTGSALGTYLAANDGDGWDPDPSDPGDWISTADETNVLFPASTCGSSTGGPTDSSWHGTRVMGLLGALTNNSVGIAGMTWNPYLLPVRSLGKCGGYDSDIIAGMQWAAGMSVTGVPDNPYPADIINLSLGGTGTCPSTSPYYSVINTLTGMGVLIVASAGNESGPVDEPGSCPGVLAVAGLRNVGTKVGYSSLGAQVGISAPAGNCVNSSGACLKSIDTTSNTGLTVPGTSTYTDQINTNLGTSFSAPIVSGIAALMRAVNANLTPAQLIARLKSSATAFPQPTGLPVCPSADASSGECACPTDGSQCGAGMVNALQAVNAALRPIAAVVVPATTAAGSTAVLDASGSAASCGRTIASYAWAASGGVTIQSGGNAAQVSVVPTGASGSLTLTVTDSTGAIDTATLAVNASGAITAASTTPTTAGTSASACPSALTVAPVVPTVAEAFSPASVGENVVSTLTITLSNANGFALTQSSFTETLPSNLSIATSSASTSVAPATTCGGSAATLTKTTSTVTLSAANIPANGSCTITVPVQSATPGTYTNTVAASALTTAPAGANADTATATLTVTAPTKSGGGALDWWDTLFVVGVLLAGRKHAKSKFPRG
ncbi:MAG TPA: S8 family peptidase [Steroidobacteraceae bacterium]|nr:S8 family peptidase [Steroidobacteraceae bacterium]